MEKDTGNIKDNGEKETNKIPFLKRYWVFNATQIENFPEFVKPEIPEEKFNPVERAEMILQGFQELTGLLVEHRVQDKAYYSLSQDKVSLPMKTFFKNEQAYYNVALHELAHSTMHEKRLHRKEGMQGSFGTPSYAKEELRAEMASAMLCASNGILLSEEHIKQHAAYLQSWISILQKDKREIFKAASEAKKIANFCDEVGLKYKKSIDEKVVITSFESAEQFLIAKNIPYFFVNKDINQKYYCEVVAKCADGVITKDIGIYSDGQYRIHKNKDLFLHGEFLEVGKSYSILYFNGLNVDYKLEADALRKDPYNSKIKEEDFEDVVIKGEIVSKDDNYIYVADRNHITNTPTTAEFLFAIQLEKFPEEVQEELLVNNEYVFSFLDKENPCVISNGKSSLSYQDKNYDWKGYYQCMQSTANITLFRDFNTNTIFIHETKNINIEEPIKKGENYFVTYEGGKGYAVSETAVRRQARGR